MINPLATMQGENLFLDTSCFVPSLDTNGSFFNPEFCQCHGCANSRNLEERILRDQTTIATMRDRIWELISEFEAMRTQINLKTNSIERRLDDCYVSTQRTALSSNKLQDVLGRTTKLPPNPPPWEIEANSIRGLVSLGPDPFATTHTYGGNAGISGMYRRSNIMRTFLIDKGSMNGAQNDWSALVNLEMIEGRRWMTAF
jgi:hypothetical protein